MKTHTIKRASRKSLVARFIADQQGAAFLEYTLLVGLLGLAMLTFFSTTATSTQNNLNEIAVEIDNSQ